MGCLQFGHLFAVPSVLLIAMSVSGKSVVLGAEGWRHLQQPRHLCCASSLLGGPSKRGPCTLTLRGGMAANPMESFSMDNLDQMPTADDLAAGNMPGGGEDMGGEERSLERMMAGGARALPPQMSEDDMKRLEQAKEAEEQERQSVLKAVLAPEARQRCENTPLSLSPSSLLAITSSPRGLFC